MKELYKFTTRGSGEITFYKDYCIFETQIENPQIKIKFPYTDFNNNVIDFDRFKELQDINESAMFLIKNWKTLNIGEEL